MNGPSQYTHDNSVMNTPNQALSRARNQTMVVERRRRRILLASKPGASGPMMVAVEDVEVVRTTTVHPSDDTRSLGRTESPRNEYPIDMKNASDLSSKARAINGRARYMNGFQQRHYHYLPNGPARRSRYDVPPKQHKPASSSFMPPTTHVIHPREQGEDGQNYQREFSPPPSSYTSHCDTAPYVHPHPEQGSSYPSGSSSSYSHPSRSRSDFNAPTPAPSDIYPSSHSTLPKEPQPYRSRFELSPSDHVEDVESPSSPMEGLGSREHELMELREFWKEFYGS